MRLNIIQLNLNKEQIKQMKFHKKTKQKNCHRVSSRMSNFSSIYVEAKNRRVESTRTHPTVNLPTFSQKLTSLHSAFLILVLYLSPNFHFF